MSEHRNTEGTGIGRRDLLQSAGVMTAALAAPTVIAANAAAAEARTTATRSRNNGPLGTRLQGVQHFGLTVQNMDRAFAFYTEVLNRSIL